MDLRYPIGPFDWNTRPAANARPELIDQLAAAAALLRQAVAGLDDKQLDTPYRPEGWTIRQVVHHMADSHANMYLRLRFALTENQPTIKPYDEKLWAELSDARSLPVEPSLALLDNLHQRCVALMGSLSEQDWSRAFVHPEVGVVHLDSVLAGYAWHGRHHTAHITGLRERMGWNDAVRHAATK
jgi:hypothetical protein